MFVVLVWVQKIVGLSRIDLDIPALANWQTLDTILDKNLDKAQLMGLSERLTKGF